jgi:lysophospholipase L1-like esterase
MPRKPIALPLDPFILVSFPAITHLVARRSWGQDDCPRRRAKPSYPRCLPLLSGDRVVFLGDGFVERMQSDEYVETLLTSRLPATAVTFRNLGWSGDTVQGIARAVFGNPEEGFARLKKDVTEAEPSVIVVAFGGNEAHAGEAGLSFFRHQLGRLIDELGSATGARFILLAPRPYEKLGAPLPDPAPYNEKLQAYVEVLREEAVRRQIPLVTFPEQDSTLVPPRTTDGVHLTASGYWHVARELAEALGYSESPWEFDFDAESKVYNAVNVSLQTWEKSGNKRTWILLDRYLPAPFPPAGQADTARRHDGPIRNFGQMRIRGLEPGTYQLLIDDVPAITASAGDWEQGQALPLRAGSTQVEELRQTIREKNELYFHRHRPQNETYLFLFRKHEQGNNAVEIPQFDPLVAEKEEQISKLKQPKPGRYELIRID